jgi:hypothetical protein
MLALIGVDYLYLRTVRYISTRLAVISFLKQKSNISKSKMLKTFLISIILLLTNAIACGQHLNPKRIVFSGDTGIFFTHKQEIELLVKFKQFEGCKLEKAKW